jgi:anaerobic selenocysteine-containing dehydrogenase
MTSNSAYTGEAAGLMRPMIGQGKRQAGRFPAIPSNTRRCNMQNEDRRGFLKAGSAVIATGVIGSLGVNAHASDKDHMEQAGPMMGEKGQAAYPVKAQEKGICATCQFWGGVRRVSEDRKTVYSESLGWCNNSKSRFFQTKTTPINGPMNSWKKWEAL